nr:TMEM175 family protein [uncultured Methanoregula sp.]
MKSWKEYERFDIFDKSRVDTLTDGVFAIAMTLLVTGLDIPRLGGIITSGTVDTVILNLFPDVIHYLIAFILLANFWWAHHLRSHYLKAASRKIIFLNMVTLLFVGLIPFSTNLVGDFPLNAHAALIFEVNLLCLGLLSVLQWNNVIASGICLKKDANQKIMTMLKEDAYIFPILSFVAIVLSLVSIPWSAFIYFIAPVYILVVQWKDTKITHDNLKVT